MADLEHLHSAASIAHSHHWKVTFEVLVELKSEDGTIRDWELDFRVVSAGPDSRQAVEAVADYVKTDDFGMPILDFRALDVKLLSEAEVYA